MVLARILHMVECPVPLCDLLCFCLSILFLFLHSIEYIQIWFLFLSTDKYKRQRISLKHISSTTPHSSNLNWTWYKCPFSQLDLDPKKWRNVQWHIFLLQCKLIKNFSVYFFLWQFNKIKRYQLKGHPRVRRVLVCWVASLYDTSFDTKLHLYGS